MLFGTLAPRGIMGDIPEPSLPWIISTLLVICLALIEEIAMTKEADEAYLTYKRKTPFMLPLPRFLLNVITAPNRLILKKDLPTKRKDVLYTFAIYFAISILLSIIFLVLIGRTWLYPFLEPAPPCPCASTLGCSKI